MTLKSVKKGTTFYDCGSGWNKEYTATEKPRIVEGGFAVLVKRKTGQLFEFKCSTDYKVFKTPQHSSTVNGQVTFPTT
jgi:hypothetical protein